MATALCSVLLLLCITASSLAASRQKRAPPLVVEIHAVPVPLVRGLTPELTVNCNLKQTQTPDFTGDTLILSADIASKQVYTELASISNFHQDHVEQSDVLNGHVISVHNATTGSASISFTIPNPGDDAEGTYKCQAYGVDKGGHPRTSEATTIVVQTQITNDMLLNEIKALKADRDTQKADVTSLRQQLDALKNSTGPVTSSSPTAPECKCNVTSLERDIDDLATSAATMMSLIDDLNNFKSNTSSAVKDLTSTLANTSSALDGFMQGAKTDLAAVWSEVNGFKTNASSLVGDIELFKNATSILRYEFNEYVSNTTSLLESNNNKYNEYKTNVSNVIQNLYDQQSNTTSFLNDVIAYKTNTDLLNGALDELRLNTSTLQKDFSDFKANSSQSSLNLTGNILQELAEYKSNTTNLISDLNAQKVSISNLWDDFVRYNANTTQLLNDFNMYRTDTAIVLNELNKNKDDTASLLQDYKSNATKQWAEFDNYRNNVSSLLLGINDGFSANTSALWSELSKYQSSTTSLLNGIDDYKANTTNLIRDFSDFQKNTSSALLDVNANTAATGKQLADLLKQNAETASRLNSSVANTTLLWSQVGDLQTKVSTCACDAAIAELKANISFELHEHEMSLDYLTFWRAQIMNKHFHSTYLLSSQTNTNVTEANSLCRSQGGYLAEIDDEDEYHRIQGLVQNSGSLHKVMVGGTDAHNEGHWRFVTSGGEMTFFDWGPQSHPSTHHNANNCLFLTHEQGTGSWVMEENTCLLHDVNSMQARILCELNYPD